MEFIMYEYGDKAAHKQDPSTDSEVSYASPIDVSDHARFPFFALPPELRDRIYTIAFEEQIPSLQSHHDVGQHRPSGIIYFPGFDLRVYKWGVINNRTSAFLHTAKFPGYQLVSKKFLAEAIAVFARGKVFEILSFPHGQHYSRGSLLLHGLSPALASQNSSHHVALLQAVRRLRLPAMKNQLPGRTAQATLGFSVHDVKASSNFRNLRGLSTLPPELELVWTYTFRPHAPYQYPLFMPTIIGFWQDLFVRVNITVTIGIQDFNGPLFQGVSTLSDDDQLSLAFVKSTLYEVAAIMAEVLVRKNGPISFGLSKKEEMVHWSGSACTTMTLEAVEGGTRHVKPVALLDYHGQIRTSATEQANSA